MDNLDDTIPLHQRVRKHMLGVALKTISTRIDESRKFHNGLYQKANETTTKKKLKAFNAIF